MRLAQIVGHVTATVKHKSLHGQRLLIAQPVNADGQDDGAPQVVIDPLGAARGQRVLISSDGSEARKIVADGHSPARWFVAGIVDERSAA
ncbi:MAG: EutN/CcmL family microcompartment protein [Verrucomicrobiales bacterium]|nr:EutN/CcmL family microcompartment protein [Verrucomicrobiales bacterium]